MDNPRDDIGSKRFFLTPSHPCSYLDDREAHTLFLDPRDTHSPQTYSTLTTLGFRRSGGHLYRPHCGSCTQCVPTRIPVDQFAYSRRFRRVLKQNADLVVRFEPAMYTGRNYDLYDRYITARHQDGDMFPPTPEQFRAFLLASWSETRFLSMYLDDELVCIAATDLMSHGLSAIYTFFDPALSNRSLGVFAILKQLEACRERGLPFLYLGYWIENCEKMSYKTDYRPIELLIDHRWVQS